ncbi:MAG: MBL fold metallo-hydrolase [Proteobacteria bacterium]|nr:MBL fold metallo-hydrolase [Pseudomonadota bacterium]MBU1687056.1 MBL fold metallo-hydrolase [Pseudomonadota bacterium]
MWIKFWGVRGSIPCPGSTTIKYGGNTACIELCFPEHDRRIIIDAGSGIRELGNQLLAMEHPKGAIKTELFLTHTHWDHIMGYPFFAPIYLPTTELKVYGPVNHEGESLEKVVGDQMSYRYFPVRHLELAAKIKYTSLKEGRFNLGDGIILTTKYLNHPVLCLGYRFEYKKKIFCTAYDTEPFQNLFQVDPKDPSYDAAMVREGALVAEEQNRGVEDFYRGADLLVHDAQYTRDEYEATKVGWGHTAMEYAIAAANRGRVKNLILFHHEPVRTDREFDELADQFEDGRKYGATRLYFAREGLKINL